MRINRILGFLTLGILLIGCGEEVPNRNTSRPSSQNKKTLIKVEFDKKGTIVFADSIAINVQATDTHLTLKTLRITQPGMSFEKVLSTGQTTIHTTNTGGGNVRLKFEAVFENGEKSTRYKEFLVVANKVPTAYQMSVIRSYPHDPSSFTQGLLIYNNALYEGTGNYGETRLRKMDLGTGKVHQQKDLESDIFGEGITIFDGKLYQLTYKASLGFIYNLETFDREDEFIYNTHTSEGWGLTHNDTALIATDGSPFIYFLDPANFSEIKRLKVFDNHGEVEYLNELEYYNGYLYANIYSSAKIVKIDPITGEIVEEYVAKGIVSEADVTSNMDVLNGIAFNPGTGNMLITGKYWSKIYEVEMKPAK